MRDLLVPSARSVGVVEVDEEKGITKIARLMALKGRNAISVVSWPKGLRPASYS